MVVFDPGGTSNIDLFSDFGDVMLEVFRTSRIGAKPPQRAQMRERKLDVLPRPEVLAWPPAIGSSVTRQT
jgi:hypothetical protein